MQKALRFSLLASATALLIVASSGAQAQAPQSPNMTFFVTSAPIGKGGDLGGLEGADAHCQQLAATVGAGGKTWHAYLSGPETPQAKGVNARDRIGNGPWQNFKGVVIATERRRSPRRRQQAHQRRPRSPNAARGSPASASRRTGTTL